MKTSESLSNIAAALSKAQGAMPAALKDGTGNHGRYATLGSVISAASPVLSANGLSFVQMPSEAENGYMALTTRILHESGEWIEDTMRAAIGQARGSEVQAAGSVISYLRRYALSAALGITTEDNDGTGAQPAPKAPAARQQAPQPRTQAAQAKPAARAAEHAGKATGEVIAINRALKEDYGFKEGDREQAISLVAFLANVPGLASTKDLTDGEARGVLEKLNACKDADARAALIAQWADRMAAA